MGEYFGKGIAISTGFDLNSPVPLDSRAVTDTVITRDAIPAIRRYVGLRVYVVSTGAEYRWDGTNWKTQTSAYLTGEGDPLASIGAEGDTYIDTKSGPDQGDFWHKTATGWEFKMNIKGPQGDKGDKGSTGTRGSMIYMGSLVTGVATEGTVFTTGIPNAIIGDLYINNNTGSTSSYNLYSCVLGGASGIAQWAYIFNIKGIKGDKGDKGDQGDKGETGIQGEQGGKGDIGLTGRSAYTEAVNWGFVGTEQEWLASLKGPVGPTGGIGPKGTTGLTGVAGSSGKSAYQIAVDKGFVGTEDAWLDSLSPVLRNYTVNIISSTWVAIDGIFRATITNASIGIGGTIPADATVNIAPTPGFTNIRMISDCFVLCTKADSQFVFEAQTAPSIAISFDIGVLMYPPAPDWVWK